MATVIDSLVISLGLDPTPVKSGLNQLAGLAAKFAGPIAGAFSINKIVSGYMKDVGEVARMTGRYSQKLEEWRYKRAMLARVTREDIELYKKCREGVVKFNIAMADLSAKIVREFHPAIKLGVDILNRFSGWVKENEHNIVRFFMVAAGVITAVFIPALVKMGLALLRNPLTGLIIALGALILVLDDLITYARGGRSAFAEFWAKFGTPEEVKQKLIAFLEKCKKLLADYLPLIVKIVGALLGLSAARGVFYLIEKALGGVGKALGVVGKALGIFLRHPALLFLMAAAYFIYQRWDGMVEGMKALIADLTSAWRKAVDWLADYIGSVVDGWNLVKEKCKKIIDDIADGWHALTEDLISVWKKAVDWLADYIGSVVDGWNLVKEKCKSIYSGMVEGMKALIADLISVWGKAVDWMANYIGSVVDGWNLVKEKCKSIYSGMVEGMKALIADLTSAWKKAVDWVANYIGSVVDGWTALTDKCKSIYSGMVDWTADYIEKIAQGWKDLTGDLSAAYNKAVNFTVELMEKAVNGVKDLRTKAVNALAGMIESLAGVLSHTWEGIKDGFNSLVDDLTAAWKRSPLYTMFSFIIDGVNAAKNALGIGGDEEQKTTGGLGGIGVTGAIAAAAAKAFDLGGLWGSAKDFLGAKFSAVPNVNQQTSAMTTSVGKQHNGDVNIDNSQNITVNGNVGDPAELADTMNEHRTTADLSDSGTYLN